MARKRSLKDAAADRLVEKPKTVPAVPAPAIKKPPTRRTAVEATQTASVRGRPAGQLLGDEIPKAPEAKKALFSLKWIALLLLIGFAGGYFFGVGQAIGPANFSYLFIGFAGGFLFGRFIKII